MYHALDERLEGQALQAISSIIATVSAGVSSATESDDPTEKALRPMIVESLANFKDPEAKSFRPAGRILSAAASASGIF